MDGPEGAAAEAQKIPTVAAMHHSTTSYSVGAGLGAGVGEGGETGSQPVGLVSRSCPSVPYLETGSMIQNTSGLAL